jgi:DNA-binding winged helix-turn-helix (wHTH) protein/TolB-like protein
VAPQSGRVYRFGPFRYDADQRVLFRGGDLVPLAPKALDTLQVLLENRDRVVPRAELLSLVWPDTTVEEIGLARNISLLRKALGDEGETGWIETIPKRGYRFAGEVTVGDGPAAIPQRSLSRRWLVAAGLTLALAVIYWQFYRPSRYLPPGSVSLAVLPFEPLGSDADVEVWSRGLHEVVSAELSKISRVHVISPATVRRYRALHLSPALMSRLLGLHVVVEGTLQKFGERLRVTARLADVHSGKLIWADSFDVPSTTDGAAQNDVARRIAAEAGARLKL